MAAIAVTTSMDASGLTELSALPLLPLMLLLWAWERFSRREMGFGWGNAQGYGQAVLHPLRTARVEATAAIHLGPQLFVIRQGNVGIPLHFRIRHGNRTN